MERQWAEAECIDSSSGIAEQRQTAYLELFRYHLGNIDIHEIRNAATFSMPLGDSRFREQIEQALGRNIGQAIRGRPVRRKAE